MQLSRYAVADRFFSRACLPGSRQREERRQSACVVVATISRAQNVTKSENVATREYYRVINPLDIKSVEIKLLRVSLRAGRLSRKRKPYIHMPDGQRDEETSAERNKVRD